MAFFTQVNLFVILTLIGVILWQFDSTNIQLSFKRSHVTMPLATYSHSPRPFSPKNGNSQDAERDASHETDESGLQISDEDTEINRERRLRRGKMRQHAHSKIDADIDESSSSISTSSSLSIPLSSYSSSSSSSSSSLSSSMSLSYDSPLPSSISSNSPKWHGSCPSGNPKGNLKVVSDITKVTDHVELVTDSHLPQRFKAPPKPVMSTQEKLNPLCSQFGWRFCPNPRRGNEDKNWYTCEARQFVGKVHCAFIDNQHTIPGMVYDHERSYPVHGCHPHQKGFQPQPVKKIVKLDKVAHNLAVYPTGFAHVMAQLPRLILLAQSIPSDVPILLAKSSARDSFVDLLHQRGILDKKRIMNWDPNTVYFANTLYYAGEMGRGVGTSGKWDTLKVEYCSWALVMPRERLQRIFIANYSKSAPSAMQLQQGKAVGEGLHILVVHRKDASGGRRMVKNHNVMLSALKSTFRDATVEEFIGDKFSLAASISMFTWADVVVAPHGAALGFLAFMRPGTSCVEIGYKDMKGMKFPAPYYMALALSVNVGYFLSMAEGGYGTPLTADVNDVVAVTKLAVAYASTPEAPHPNII